MRIEPDPLFRYFDALAAVDAGRFLPEEGFAQVVRALRHQLIVPGLVQPRDYQDFLSQLLPGDAVWAALVGGDLGWSLPPDLYKWKNISVLCRLTSPEETERLLRVHKLCPDLIGTLDVLPGNSLMSMHSELCLVVEPEVAYEAVISLSSIRGRPLPDERDWAWLSPDRLEVLRRITPDMDRGAYAAFKALMALGKTYQFKGFRWQELTAYDVAKAMVGYLAVDKEAPNESYAR